MISDNHNLRSSVNKITLQQERWKYTRRGSYWRCWLQVLHRSVSVPEITKATLGRYNACVLDWITYVTSTVSFFCRRKNNAMSRYCAFVWHDEPVLQKVCLRWSVMRKTPALTPGKPAVPSEQETKVFVESLTWANKSCRLKQWRS